MALSLQERDQIRGDIERAYIRTNGNINQIINGILEQVERVDLRVDELQVKYAELLDAVTKAIKSIEDKQNQIQEAFKAIPDAVHQLETRLNQTDEGIQTLSDSLDKQHQSLSQRITKLEQEPKPETEASQP